MRTLPIASLAMLVSAAPLAQPDQAVQLEHAGLSVELPEGYVLQSSCEIPADVVPVEGQSISCDSLPAGVSDDLQTATYVFVDERRYRFLTISVHNYFDEKGRSEWLDGSRALPNRRRTFTPIDAGQWTDRDVAAAEWAEAPSAGVALYGCEGWRCYTILVSGPAIDLEDDPDHYRSALAGVRVHPLAAPTVRQTEPGDR